MFLAYYLRNDVIDGSSTLSFAFIGGLSVSIGVYSLLFGEERVRMLTLPLSRLALLISPLATICIGYFGTRTSLRIGTVLEA